MTGRNVPNSPIKPDMNELEASTGKESMCKVGV